MYNSDIPTRAELPSSRQLFRSTVIAFAAALAILVTIVLPSEYAVDPTGVGKMLNLREMGEIRQQLADEAEADRQANANTPVTNLAIGEQRMVSIERQLKEIRQLLATRQDTATQAAIEEQIAVLPQVIAPQPVAPSGWQDDISITLQPGEGVEYKLVMEQGKTAEFEWTANGGVLNFDTHGDGDGNSISYERGRAVPEQSGTLEAAFSGNHGWFWRNRSEEPVTLTLRTKGNYVELKRTA